MERTEASEDPGFDCTGLRMLAAFDARRVVPVLIVTCRPSFVYLFVNPLPWSTASFAADCVGGLRARVLN